MSNIFEREPKAPELGQGNDAPKTPFSPLAVLEKFRRDRPEQFEERPEEASIEIRVTPPFRFIKPEEKSNK